MNLNNYGRKNGLNPIYYQVCLAVWLNATAHNAEKW